MNKTLKEQLLEQAEPDYQAFASALIPNINNVLGVRLPVLRQIAKQMVKGDMESYFNYSTQEWFEEVAKMKIKSDRQ